MSLALLVDFGSTYTKLTLLDLDRADVVGRAAAPTTTQNITDGLQHGLALLQRAGANPQDASLKLACSSAAGGLRVVAMGLVSELTAEAARRAALGAGARVVGVFSGLLQSGDIRAAAKLRPDMILLAGGTDGGNKRALVHNARRLAEAAYCGVSVGGDGRIGLGDVPVVVAGNQDAVPEARSWLEEAGYDVRTAANVMPRLGAIDVEPARAVMRDLFLQRIVQAKGLDAAEQFVDGVLMPTPAAVLAGARLLARGAAGREGWGDVVVVDVGGATTDVHSIGDGAPSEAHVNRKGLPEPDVKRTVEGDLGVRVSADALLESVGMSSLLSLVQHGTGDGDDPGGAVSEEEVRDYVERVNNDPERLPQSDLDRRLDETLARAAIREAMDRHVGRVEERATPLGLRRFVTGKDLRTAACLVGTGGVLVHAKEPARLLKAGLYRRDRPDVLAPEAPRLFVDVDYVLAACGLLAERAPDAALEMLQQRLRFCPV